MSLCEAEKTFILHGVDENFRVDGREREDYRTMELETDIVSHAFGSARLRLANTDILVAVKIEVDVPFPESPHQGKIEFFVDCSANATPDFEGRGGEDLAVTLSSTLNSAYSSSLSFDLKKLCILHGKKCWKLYVDILILECGGNLFDAASIAVKAALWQAQVPLVKNVNIDGNNVELDVSDELYDCTKLDVQKAPIMVTVCKIGEKCIVDPNVAEEQCSVGSVVVAVSGNKFSTVYQTGLLKCYVCSQTEDDTDTHCLDSPGSSDNDILECDKKYCYVVRQDYKDPRGKLASILRTCLDKPIYTNEVIEDDTHRAYYRACKTDLCNGGNGRTDESSGDSGAFGDKGTIYVPGTGSSNGQVINVVYVFYLISFVILYLLR